MIAQRRPLERCPIRAMRFWVAVLVVMYFVVAVGCVTAVGLLSAGPTPSAPTIPGPQHDPFAGTRSGHDGATL